MFDRHRSISGHQGAYAMREIVNAILYQGRTGCQWAYLPHDLPQKSATYCYFAAWRDDGTGQVIHELLRCQAREKARRSEDPTLVVLDTRSVRAAAGVPASTTGRDAAKRVTGRNRGLAVDVLGPVIAVIVLAANTHDNIAGTARPTRSPRTPATPSAGPWSSRDSRATSPCTAPAWVSTSRPSGEIRGRQGSSRSPNDGGSSRPSEP
ncbi:hypothetical protein Sros01_73610 [Streptomyces roseochromogenus]|nr:hypothetical protein Sros01_73610 [Streptomyces roseochromogenus]